MSEKSIFSRIIDREIPSEIVFENELVIAFRDIAPQAPVHVLVVPKVQCRDLLEADSGTIMALMEGCKEVAALLGLVGDGFRLIINTGKGGGQTVFHLHAHLLGGAPLEWGV
jgi:histidine triad (HIT) family protein